MARAMSPANEIDQPVFESEDFGSETRGRRVLL
jgi:hypothetical protein